MRWSKASPYAWATSLSSFLREEVLRKTLEQGLERSKMKILAVLNAAFWKIQCNMLQAKRRWGSVATLGRDRKYSISLVHLWGWLMELSLLLTRFCRWLRGCLLKDASLQAQGSEDPDTLLSHPACIYHPSFDTASDHGLIHPSSRKSQEAFCLPDSRSTMYG